MTGRHCGATAAQDNDGLPAPAQTSLFRDGKKAMIDTTGLSPGYKALVFDALGSLDIARLLDRWDAARIGTDVFADYPQKGEALVKFYIYPMDTRTCRMDSEYLDFCIYRSFTRGPGGRWRPQQ